MGGIFFMKTSSFFGHRNIVNITEIKKTLKNTLNNIINNDLHFLIGTHGDFDSIALSTALELYNETPMKIKISLVFSNLSILNKDKYGYKITDYLKNKPIEPIIYNIEEVHYKNRITISNRNMIDNSDLIICFVDMNKRNSGAKNAIIYAEKNNKKIINLYEIISK